MATNISELKQEIAPQIEADAIANTGTGTDDLLTKSALIQTYDKWSGSLSHKYSIGEAVPVAVGGTLIEDNAGGVFAKTGAEIDLDGLDADVKTTLRSTSATLYMGENLITAKSDRPEQEARVGNTVLIGGDKSYIKLTEIGIEEKALPSGYDRISFCAFGGQFYAIARNIASATRADILSSADGDTWSFIADLSSIINVEDTSTYPFTNAYTGNNTVLNQSTDTIQESGYSSASQELGVRLVNIGTHMLLIAEPVAGDFYGAWRSTDGITWSDISANVFGGTTKAKSGYKVLTSGTKAMVAFVDAGVKLSVTTDNGASWTIYSTSIDGDSYVVQDDLNPDKIGFCDSGISAFFTTDFGTTVTDLEGIIGAVYPEGLYVYNGIWIAISYFSTIYRSTDDWASNSTTAASGLSGLYGFKGAITIDGPDLVSFDMGLTYSSNFTASPTIPLAQDGTTYLAGNNQVHQDTGTSTETISRVTSPNKYASNEYSIKIDILTKSYIYTPTYHSAGAAIVHDVSGGQLIEPVAVQATSSALTFDTNIPVFVRVK